ncbi:hypothetical protein ACJVDH_05395 [Pedobacter sp. AW1-32]|uniref:hypothetical protein n=1 Tax=Pedobacter sp. AW1-32 TaxID=3383026 RepID=UPI003FEF4772
MDLFRIKFLTMLIILAFIALLPLMLIAIVRITKLKLHLKRILMILLSVMQLTIFCTIYMAFYPTDSFFFDEYLNVVGKPIPDSARVIAKSASYPDFQGAYNSISLFRLSDYDYDKLLQEIYRNKNFKKADVIYSETYYDVFHSYKNLTKIDWFARRNARLDMQYHLIGFLKDQKTIIIYCINN